MDDDIRASRKSTLLEPRIGDKARLFHGGMGRDHLQNGGRESILEEFSKEWVV